MRMFSGLTQFGDVLPVIVLAFGRYLTERLFRIGTPILRSHLAPFLQA
jgi:hypothetical protein